MKRISRIPGTSGTSPLALFGAMVLLAATSASVAAADDGPAEGERTPVGAGNVAEET